MRTGLPGTDHRTGLTAGSIADAAGRRLAHHHAQVTLRGEPLVDDPKRLDGVSAVGVDETAFLRACRTHPTLYATGIADLTPGVIGA